MVGFSAPGGQLIRSSTKAYRGSYSLLLSTTSGGHSIETDYCSVPGIHVVGSAYVSGEKSQYGTISIITQDQYGYTSTYSARFFLKEDLTWQRIFVFCNLKGNTKAKISVTFDDTTGKTFSLDCFQLETGWFLTDWRPAIEDTEQKLVALSTKVDSLAINPGVTAVDGGSFLDTYETGTAIDGGTI
jgi:hypothetical protein